MGGSLEKRRRCVSTDAPDTDNMGSVRGHLADRAAEEGSALKMGGRCKLPEGEALL